MAGSTLRMGFALSKWPHFHRVYLVTVHKRSSMAVCADKFEKATNVPFKIIILAGNFANKDEFTSMESLVKPLDFLLTITFLIWTDNIESRFKIPACFLIGLYLISVKIPRTVFD